MASSGSQCLPDDVLRTISRLVFACTASDQMTLRLFDPATGKLANYLLVKVLDDDVDLRGGSPISRSTPLPQTILDELLESLKTVVREMIPPDQAQSAAGPHEPLQASCPSAGGSSVTTKTSAFLPAGTPHDLPLVTSPSLRASHTRQYARTPALIRRPVGANAKGKPSPPLLYDGIVDREDGGPDKLCSAVPEAATGRVETQPTGHRVPDTLPARPCTPTKPKAHRAPHETLPPDGIDFPPFLVTSTPRAVARHRRSLAVRHPPETRESSKDERTRRTSLPAWHGGKPSFELAAFDPEAVWAAMAESARRAKVGVAHPTASMEWEKLRRSTAR